MILFLTERGLQAVLDFGIERPEVDAAVAYLSDEDNGMGSPYSG
jgi:hypothetical protein